MYDLIVIGAGWAGFSAAEYASGIGLKVALVDRGLLGGTCLNYGCIPTKTLLNTTKLFSQFKKCAKFGINCSQPDIDLTRLNQRVKEINSQLRGGLEFRLKSRKIDFFKSHAELVSPNQAKIEGSVLEAKYILISTGSRPIELPKIKFDGTKIISSTEALEISDVPRGLLIIGGGVIGCEFAEIYGSLGSAVEIVELTSGLLPGMDREVSRKLEVILKKRGVKISLNTDASALDFGAYDKILLCVGRAAHSDCLGSVEVKKERGRILVDEYLRTSIPNIYSAGDCIGGFLLAHVASYEGRLAVKNMFGADKEKASYRAVPSAVFTNPEIAAVGLSEEAARAEFGEIIIKKFDFRALGMSYVLDETEGFVKIIADKDESILGASIVGPKASELIHVITLALNNRMKLSQVRDTIFAHPTISEAISDALLH